MTEDEKDQLELLLSKAIHDPSVTFWLNKKNLWDGVGCELQYHSFTLCPPEGGDIEFYFNEGGGQYVE